MGKSESGKSRFHCLEAGQAHPVGGRPQADRRRSKSEMGEDTGGEQEGGVKHGARIACYCGRRLFCLTRNHCGFDARWVRQYLRLCSDARSHCLLSAENSQRHRPQAQRNPPAKLLYQSCRCFLREETGIAPHLSRILALCFLCRVCCYEQRRFGFSDKLSFSECGVRFIHMQRAGGPLCLRCTP
jgi:hypothetical protein